MRQADGDLVVRGYAVTHPSGRVVLPTAADWDQLLYASAGVMTVETNEGVWVVPPHRAIWAPAGSDHRIVMHGRVAVRTLYLHHRLRALPSTWRAVNVTPLLRELILHAVRVSPLDLTIAAHERLVGVLTDQLATLPDAPLQLPMPTDPRAAALATRLIEDVAATTPVEELARHVGASRRTLERLFLAQTGMTIGRWRQRLRLTRSMELLAAGCPVTTVAADVGYSTASAFAAMFREQTGESPGRYFDRRHDDTRV
jgi:AraC-like DNA-binding protein